MRRAGAALAAAGVVALLLAAPAPAEIAFCPFGSGAGQCERPEGVAVDSSTGAASSGNVYVVDRGNDRVNVFEPSGDFLFAFGAGQLSTAKGIAVDNDPASPAFHSVYVFDSDAMQVLKYDPEGNFLLAFGGEGAGECQFSWSEDPIAVGPGGVVYVGDSSPGGGDVKVHKFEPTGACIEDIALAETARARAIAVDSTGAFYVAYDLAGGILRKYDPSGSLLFSKDPGFENRALAIGAGDRLFAAQLERSGEAAGSVRVFTEYDGAGDHLRRFGYGKIAFNIRGMAQYSSPFGDVLGSEEYVGSETLGNRVIYLDFPPPGPIVASAGVSAVAVGNSKATLKAAINPEGAPTTYRFEYVDQAGFEEAGFSGPKVKSTPATLLGAEDFQLHGVEATVGCPDPVTEIEDDKCLTPSTTYRFRVVATSPDGPGEGTIAGPAFETKPPLELDSWSTGVGTDSAVLHGEVNPLGIPASGYFEYVSEAEYQESGFDEATRAPAGFPLAFGSGEAPVVRAVTLDRLQLGATYRYRLVAENPLIEPIAGEERTFTTFALPRTESCPPNEAFRTGPSSRLPDCRAYELVSPLDKDNGDIIPLGEGTTALPATLDQSSLAGDKLAFGSYRSFGDAQSAAFTTQYVAARGDGGWATHAIASPRGHLTLPVGAELDTELKALSPDLCDAWFRTAAEPALTPDAVPGFSNIYRRHDQGCAGGFGYEALTTVEPPNIEPAEYFPLELQGLSADGMKSVYVANDALTAEAPVLAGAAPSNRQLYFFDGAASSFVCVLPDGNPSETPCQAGGPGNGLSRTATVENAISTDGRRVFWTAYSGIDGTGQIYLRSNPGETQSAIAGGECTEAVKACTIAVSEQAEDMSGTSTSRYWAAAGDGSRAIFTTADTGTGVSDLYEFEVATQTTRLIAHDSPGILGASEDAKSIYFASEEVLGGENAEGKEAVEGKPNLYLERNGETRFVGTLADIDVANTNLRPSAVNQEPRYRLARTTADGAHAAFMSAASLTGYDNADAASGKADAEVFLYDAEANGGEGALRCASCNPTGARPAGEDLVKGAQEYWAAAQIPVWQNTLYASRALAEDGNRLYFESTDTLVPRDTNGVQDVYQWEAAGSGGCDSSDSTYSQASGGCVELISSGKSARAAQFTDASPDGEDVFFATLAGLVSQDYGLVDIYDARVGGGFAPPPPPEPECEGEACQSPAPAPAPLTPSSLSYRGPGDLAPAARKARRCPKGKRRVKIRRGKAKGRTRCVKRKRVKRRKARHVRHRRKAPRSGGRAGGR